MLSEVALKQPAARVLISWVSALRALPCARRLPLWVASYSLHMELLLPAQIDPTLLLNAIAAAVIGGVSLFGGRGSVWAVVLGALIIGSVVNGLALLGQTADVSEMVEGVVLLIAVTVDALVRRAQQRTGR